MQPALLRMHNAACSIVLFRFRARRIQRSSVIGKTRVNKMKARDALLQALLSDCTTAIGQVSHSGSDYTQLLKDLLVQSLIKIEEEEVFVHVRKEDISAVKVRSYYLMHAYYATYHQYCMSGSVMTGRALTVT